MRRSALKDDPNKIRYGSQEALFGRLICGECGRKLKRYKKPNGTADWRCRKRAYEKRSGTKECKSQCGCRHVPEAEVKKAILTAFNELPGRRDELIRRQAQIEKGELKRIDALVDKSKKAEMKMEARRLKLETDHPESDEIAYLEQQIAEEQENRNALILERSDHANREVRIRLLLELADEMKAAADEHKDYIGLSYLALTDPTTAFESMPVRRSAEPEDAPPSCTGYDEFFRRTRYRLPEELLGEDGSIARFDNSMVTRYLETVTVFDDRYEVNFKAGLTISVGVAVSAESYCSDPPENGTPMTQP